MLEVVLTLTRLLILSGLSLQEEGWDVLKTFCIMDESVPPPCPVSSPLPDPPTRLHFSEIHKHLPVCAWTSSSTSASYVCIREFITGSDELMCEKCLVQGQAHNS